MSRPTSDEFIAVISLTGALADSAALTRTLREWTCLASTSFLAAAISSKPAKRETVAVSADRRIWCVVDGHIFDPVDQLSPEEVWDRAGVTEGGSFNLVFWNENTRQAAVRSDPLGFRTLYYWVAAKQDTLVLTSSLRLMRKVVPTLRPDAAGFVEQLLLSATLSGRTLLQEVRRLEPGTELRLSEAGLRVARRPHAKYFGSAHSGASTADAARLIVAEARRVTTDWLGGRSVSVALSGGYDSRFLLLMALEAGVDVQTITLGDHHWVDATLASKVAAFHGVRHHSIASPPKISLDEYIGALESVEHVSDYMSGFWASSVAIVVARQRRPILNGFLGGPVSGAALHWTCSEPRHEADIVTAWIDHVNEANVPFALLSRVCRRDIPDQEGLQLRLVPILPQEVAPFQAATWLEFAVRQRGFVSPGTYGFYRRFSEPLIPLADLRFVQLFGNLDESQLRNQLAYRTAVSSLDKSGIPFASTSGKRPDTFTVGPQQVVERGFELLAAPLADLCRTYARELEEILDAHTLAKWIESPVSDSRNPTAPQRLMLANAAILWLVYSGALAGSSA